MAVQPNFARTRQTARPKQHERPDSHQRQHNAQCTSGDAQYRAFGEALPEKPAFSGAQRHAKAEFTLA